MKRFFTGFWLGLALLPMALNGAARNYGAGLDQASWQLTDNDPLSCAIEQQIPFFGSARFVQEAGRQMHLELQSESPFKASTLVQLLSQSAPWSDEQIRRPLAQIRIAAAQPMLKVSVLASRRAYFDLRQGLDASFRFRDPQDDLSDNEVRVSTVHFRAIDESFKDCIAALYPDNFDDVSSARVYFGHDSEFPIENGEAVLEPLLNYLAVDKSIKQIRLTGLTDTTGRICYNENLAKRRVQYVRDWLELAGVDPALLVNNALGEASMNAPQLALPSAIATHSKKGGADKRDPGRRVVIVEMIR